MGNNPFKPGDVVRAVNTFGSGVWFKKGDLLVVQPHRDPTCPEWITILAQQTAPSGVVKKGDSGQFCPSSFELVSRAPVTDDDGRAEREAAVKAWREAAAAAVAARQKMRDLGFAGPLITTDAHRPIKLTRTVIEEY